MYRKNTAGQFIVVQLLLTATGAVATGLSPAARRCIDGTFAAGGGTFTEDGTTGSYKYALAQADTNGNDISIIVTATGAIPVVVNFVTTAADPTNAATFGITDIDATISSRMATYSQPSGFLTATFPAGTIANQTNITGGTLTTVTTATNLTTNNDKTGYSLTQAFPSNFSSLSITAAGLVAVTSGIKKNAASRLTFTMTDSTNHNPVTGKTVAGQVSIDGAAFVATNTANATEISNGDYTLALAAADTNGNALMFRFTATGCDDLNIFVLTQP